MTFDPVLHEYRDGDLIIQSVTQILKRAGHIDDRWYSEEARERGSAVHELCERVTKGIRTDDIGRPLDSLEYLNAFAAWMKKSRAYAIQTETTIDFTLNGHRYAGKYDLLAEIGGRRILVDYKTGRKAAWHPNHLAAYALGTNPDGAMLLYLKPTGKFIEYWLSPFELIRGIQAFKDALAA